MSGNIQTPPYGPHEHCMMVVPGQLKNNSISSMKSIKDDRESTEIQPKSFGKANSGKRNKKTQCELNRSIPMAAAGGVPPDLPHPL